MSSFINRVIMSLYQFQLRHCFNYHGWTLKLNTCQVVGRILLVFFEFYLLLREIV